MLANVVVIIIIAKKQVILKLNLDKCESKRINDFDDQNRCNYNWMRH